MAADGRPAASGPSGKMRLTGGSARVSLDEICAVPIHLLPAGSAYKAPLAALHSEAFAATASHPRSHTRWPQRVSRASSYAAPQ